MRNHDIGSLRPDQSGWRFSGVVALALAATLIPAIVTETAGPDSSASSKAVVSGFLAARTEILLSGVLFLFAMGLALAFVIAVTSLAAQAGEHVLVRVASASGLLAIALLSVYASGFSALAASIQELRGNEHLVYAVFRIMSATDDASGVFIALLVTSVSYALVHLQVAPRWLARFGLVAAVVRAIGVLDVTTLGSQPFAAFMVAGTMLCLVWLVLMGFVLCLRGEGVERSSTSG